jgi:hypothetical protein
MLHLAVDSWWPALCLEEFSMRINVIYSRIQSVVVAGGWRLRRWLRASVMATLVIGAAIPTHAASASAPLAISASVVNNCTISTLPVAFGVYDPVVANAIINLDGATNYLTYELHQDSSRTTVGGNSGAGLLAPWRTRNPA